MKAAHHFNIEGLQRMAGGLDEENASMDSVVNDIHAVDLVLSIKVGVEARLNVLDNSPP